MLFFFITGKPLTRFDFLTTWWAPGKHSLIFAFSKVIETGLYLWTISFWKLLLRSWPHTSSANGSFITHPIQRGSSRRESEKSDCGWSAPRLPQPSLPTKTNQNQDQRSRHILAHAILHRRRPLRHLWFASLSFQATKTGQRRES